MADPHPTALERREALASGLLGPTLLAIALAAVFIVDGVARGPVPAVLAVSAGVATWMGVGWWVLRDGSSPAAWIWFAVLAALLVALTAQSPVFGFVAWTGYVYLPRALPRRALPLGVVAVALSTALSQVGGSVAADASGILLYAVVVAVNAVVAGVVLWFAWAAEQQSEERRQGLAELTDANERLERMLRENAALQAQLVVQAREAGVADERSRLAGEIHDTLAQGLTGIITQLEAARAEAPDDGARRLDAAERLARESLSEARRSVRALRPEPLRGARLPEALGDVAARWSALHDVDVEVTTTGDAQPLLPEVEVTLLRAAQEGLANVAKHARARRVGLTLSYMGDEVTLDVRDDGVGFAPVAASGDGGFGLVAMRERVARLDGTLAVESAPGTGTALSATVPALRGGEPT